MSIPNITEKPEIDMSIEEYDYHSYEPFAGNNLNNPGEIRTILKGKSCSHTQLCRILFLTVSW